MKLSRFVFITLLIAVPILFAPLQASAAGLVPCGTSTNPEPCTLCHILIGGKGLIDWGMGIMVIVGLALIMIAGIMYIVSVGDSGLMTKAKDAIKTVLIGTVLVLCGWLIVNTIIGILASDNMGIGIQKANWYSFTCDSKSSANTSGGSGTTTNASAGGADCADANATGMKQRLASPGGKMCGNTPLCSSWACDTTPWNAFIEKYRGDIPLAFVKAVIAKESSCRVNPGAMDGKSCGLTQVKFSSVGNTDCAGPAMNLNDPETNIREGMKILKTAWDTAASYDYTAIGIKRQEIAYVIYNSGVKDIEQSSDCKASDGWPAKFPRYACPIKPGDTKYNACYIREQACKVGACF